MVYPRALAMIQNTWSTNKPDYQSFINTLTNRQFDLLKSWNVNYSLSFAKPVFKITKEDQGKLTQIKDISSEEKIEKMVPVKNNLPLIKENPSVIASQITLNSPTKIMAKSDSAKIQKKKRYVDPSTLLFSVEHKDVIEKSKDGSNVATIDLNTK